MKRPAIHKFDSDDVSALRRIADGKASAGDRDSALLVVAHVNHLLLQRVERLEYRAIPFYRRVWYRIARFFRRSAEA